MTAVSELGDIGAAGELERHGRPLAVEQRGPEPVLRRAHPMADGGGGHAKLSGGVLEAQMARRRLEGPDRGEGLRPRVNRIAVALEAGCVKRDMDPE